MHALHPADIHAMIHERIMRGDRARGSAEFLRDAIDIHESIRGPVNEITLWGRKIAVLHGWATHQEFVTRQDLARINTYVQIALRNPEFFPEWMVEKIEDRRRITVKFRRRKPVDPSMMVPARIS